MDDAAECLSDFPVFYCQPRIFGKIPEVVSHQHYAKRDGTVSPFTNQLIEALSDGLKNAERAQKAIATFRSLVQATSSANAKTYKKLAKNLVLAK